MSLSQSTLEARLHNLTATFTLAIDGLELSAETLEAAEFPGSITIRQIAKQLRDEASKIVPSEIAREMRELYEKTKELNERLATVCEAEIDALRIAIDDATTNGDHVNIVLTREEYERILKVIESDKTTTG